MKHKYNFSPTITSNVEFLNRLAKTKSDKRKHTLLVSASPEQILAIVEVSANILKNNFVLTNRQKKRLAHYAEAAYNRLLAFRESRSMYRVIMTRS